jgi:hypothetical protein
MDECHSPRVPPVPGGHDASHFVDGRKRTFRVWLKSASRWWAERSRAEVHAETMAPDGDRLVPGKVHVIRNVVILIPDIPLEGRDLARHGVLHRVVVGRVAGGDEQDANIRPVGGLEIGQAQHALAARQLMDCGRAPGFVGALVKVAGLQRQVVRGQSHRRCCLRR